MFWTEVQFCDPAWQLAKCCGGISCGTEWGYAKISVYAYNNSIVLLSMYAGKVLC